MAQWVKISALSLLWLRLLLWLRFGLWPWNFHIPQVQPKNNNKNSPNSLPYGVIARIKQKIGTEHLEECWHVAAFKLCPS